MRKGVAGWKTIVHSQKFLSPLFNNKDKFASYSSFYLCCSKCNKNDCMFHVWNIVKVTGKEPVLIKEKKPKKSKNGVRIKNKEIYNRKKRKS